MNITTSNGNLKEFQQEIVDNAKKILKLAPYTILILPCICAAQLLMKRMGEEDGKPFHCYMASFFQNPMNPTEHDNKWVDGLMKLGYNVFIVPCDHHFSTDDIEDPEHCIHEMPAVVISTLN